jgi:hypothetical protein
VISVLIRVRDELDKGRGEQRKDRREGEQRRGREREREKRESRGEGEGGQRRGRAEGGTKAVTFKCCWRMAIPESFLKKEIHVPVFPALPVRPDRWT